MKISNGFLEVEYYGPFAEERQIVSLEKIIETQIITSALYVRLPTYDFQPLNRFLQNKNCRRHTLLSYGTPLIFGRRLQELQVLEKWLATNIDAAKSLSTHAARVE